MAENKFKENEIMATVKFDEGTKFETSLNLEEGEGVIFVRHTKNKLIRNMDSKVWDINLVITNNRLVIIPVPPNKKNKQVESYYFKEMSEAVAVKGAYADSGTRQANFIIKMKQTNKSSYIEGGEFWVWMSVNFFSVFLYMFRAIFEGIKDMAATAAAHAEAEAATDASIEKAKATGASSYTQYSPNYAALERAAKDRATNMDFSKESHTKIRDYIVDLINTCVEDANK